jgi:1,4-alpha-glucan branching enzyme
MDAQDLYGRSPLYNRILKGVLLAANRVTACSKATLNDLSRYHGISFGNRASVVYNGVSTNASRAGGAGESSAPYFLAMGRMVPQKGFSELLHAFARAKTNFSLVLAGDGPQLEHLKGLSGRLGLEGRVCFVGRADRSRVSQLMGSASGLVVPSLREPMGIVALEGMAAGKPLLVSAVDGLQEVAPASPWCRQVVPGDVAALARGIEWLESLQTRNDAPLSGPMKWVEQYNWEYITDNYMRIYEAASSDCTKR